ncbi:NCBP2AS2-like [Homarus americanus]|uniref:Mediator of RNA polymerase II transcription subunit 9 n=1 Tax=Homarus americanus TaxID=6706 RepID=A0A8J5MQQ4_HOMAM|nr:NCBP2AS2-like [Homarus americanus]
MSSQVVVADEIDVDFLPVIYQYLRCLEKEQADLSRVSQESTQKVLDLQRKIQTAREQVRVNPLRVASILQREVMVLRYLLQRLLNSPEIIDKLAESYPIRRAAQLTAYAFQRGKEAIESEGPKRVGQFKKDFTQEVKEGFKKIQEENKKR